jgi:hypothetical protein
MSKKRKAPTRDPLLLELVAGLGAGGIEIGPIHMDGELLHGLCEGSRVYVDPTVSTVDTLLHELAHRMRPEWSERTVRARTAKLMGQLTRAEMDRIYAIALSTAKTRKTPKKV